MSSRRSKPKQVEMDLPTWGGRRTGAGRKSRTGQRGVTHVRRAELDPRLPLHVTLRVARHVYNLRSRRALVRLRASLRGGGDRFGVRIVQLSIQGNHIHCLVEAPDKASLAAAMKGLSVRVARRMNALMGRRGRVMADRFHARALATPTEVRTVMHYLEHNRRHHVPSLPEGYVDVYVLTSGTADAILPEPSIWLLRTGWRRGRVARDAMRWAS